MTMVAVKMLTPRRTLQLGEANAHRMQETKYFEQEIDLLRSLKHPNVVKFIEVFDDGHQADCGLLLVMEYMEGGDLCHFVEKYAGRIGEVFPFSSDLL